VNWDNKAIYVANGHKITRGSIASGCKLTYESIIRDGVPNKNYVGQIAQDKIVRSYIVNGGFARHATPTMGIFRVKANGELTPVGIGQFPLMGGAVAPLSAVVVGVK
jgi:hypothetical protein